MYSPSSSELSPVGLAGCNTSTLRLADIWRVLVAWSGRKLPGMRAMLCPVDADAAVAATKLP